MAEEEVAERSESDDEFDDVEPKCWLEGRTGAREGIVRVNAEVDDLELDI